MTDLDELVATAYRVGRCGSEDRALRWLRAVTSILADWGGRDAARALREALPADLFSGPGTSGRSHASAVAAAGTEGAGVVLFLEAERRAQQPDPGKVGMTARPLLGLLKERIGAARADRVAAALPAGVAALFRDASTAAPYPYRLIPQSYARPAGHPPTVSHVYGEHHDHD